MEEYYLLMDVGGTQIKAGLFDGQGNLTEPIRYVSSCAAKPREMVIGNFANIIRGFLDRGVNDSLSGIGMAFPGPFDYERGISMMKDLGKFDSIFGLSIEEEVKKLVPGMEKVPFCFLHDVEAFAIGECWFGEAKCADKLLCLCIGTGAGSAFIRDKKAVKKEGNGVPLNGWLYNTPYRDAVIDEYLSVRGLERLSERLIGTRLSGKELSERCRGGDGKALEVYREFGMILADCIGPFLQSFRPDALVLGGQISKGFLYFGEKLRAECERLNISVFLEPDTSLMAMKGLWASMKTGWVGKFPLHSFGQRQGGNEYVEP